MNPKVSVLLNTLNEERNIRNCLESVKWADEIVVVDMYSDDKTVQIAQEYTDKVFFHERMGYADPARQFALEQVSNDWILLVDADELIPRRLRDCILEIAACDQWDVVLIPRTNYFFGHAMKGANWGPMQDVVPRFFKRPAMRFSEQVHRFYHPDPTARVRTLNDESCAIIHFNYVDVEQFIEKLNRYTTIEANLARAQGRQLSLTRVLYEVIREVGGRFIVRKGYRDGFQGFLLSMLMASYHVSSALKLYLLNKYDSEEVSRKILDDYECIASRTLAEYG
ncbi:MAG: glycosyltransferase family 2 protein [Armatimonadetes bacterium]|nr:glycosyltransferase family 2 protein [Armatimonadota bacterium]